MIVWTIADLAGTRGISARWLVFQRSLACWR